MLDLYKKFSKAPDLYRNEDIVTSEADMREELRETLWGNERGAWILYRRAIQENGYPKKCECRKNNRSNEPDRDIKCGICNGLGYYYADYITRAYINHSQAYSQYLRIEDMGGAKTQYKAIYFEWDFLSRETGNTTDIPNKFDKIYQLQQDLDGKLISPTKIDKGFEIISVDPYRLDNTGRIEYYRVRVISVIDESFLV